MALTSFIHGHGATLGCGTTTTWTPDYTSIGGWGVNRESVDTSHLGTTGTRTYIGGGLYAIDPFTCEFLFDMDEITTAGDCFPDDILFDSGTVSVAETVTITYPDFATSSSGTCAGSAHVTGLTLGDLITDQVYGGSVSFMWEDMPTITEGADA